MEIKKLIDLLDKHIVEKKIYNEDADILFLEPANAITSFYTDFTLYYDPSSCFAGVKEFPKNILLTDAEIPPHSLLNAQSNLIIIAAEQIDVCLEEIQGALKTAQLLAHIYACFLSDVTSRKSVDAILKRATDFLDNSVFFRDSNSNILAYALKNNLDNKNMSDHVVEKDFFSYNVNQFISRHQNAEQVMKSELPVFFQQDSSCSYSCIVGKVVVGERLMGFVVVFAHNRDFEENDIKILSLLCRALAVVLKNSKGVNDLDNVFISQLFSRLINNDSFPVKKLEVDYAQFLKKIAPDYFLITIPYISTEADNSILPYIIAKLENTLTNRFIFTNEQCIIILNYNLNKDENEKLNIREKIIDKVLKILSEYQLVFGVSEIFSSFFDFKKYYNQAYASVRLGHCLEKKQNYYVYDYAFFYLLDSVQEYQNLSMFVHSDVEKLHQYDVANGTQYVLTLKTYLIHFKNIREASETLEIHRNTLLYRLQKIQNILGKDLNDNRTCLNLLVSTTIIDYSTVL